MIEPFDPIRFFGHCLCKHTFRSAQEVIAMLHREGVANMDDFMAELLFGHNHGDVAQFLQGFE